MIWYSSSDEDGASWINFVKHLRNIMRAGLIRARVLKRLTGWIVTVFKSLKRHYALVFGELDEAAEFVEFLADSNESGFLLHGFFQVVTIWELF